MDYHDLYYAVKEKLPSDFEMGVQHNDKNAWTLVYLWKRRNYTEEEQKVFFNSVKEIAHDLYVVGLESNLCYCCVVSDWERPTFYQVWDLIRENGFEVKENRT